MKDDEKLIQIGINRRQAIVRLATAGAAVSTVAAGCATTGPTTTAGSGGAPGVQPAGGGGATPDEAPGRPAAHDPLDPNMIDPIVPWPKLLTKDELETAAALCDVILPADARSPAASQLAVQDFVDEWVSAPYPTQLADKQIIRGGLAWLNTESGKRFGKPFVGLPAAAKHQICDDIASLKAARPRFRAGAIFFDRIRFIAMLGFYTTLEGMQDLGYIGNVAAMAWNGPPEQVLRHLKLV